MGTVRITDGAALDRELSGLAGAIRQKSGTTAPLTFPGGDFQRAVELLPTGGDRFFDACLEGTLQGEVETNATMIRTYGIQSEQLLVLRAPRVKVIAKRGLYRVNGLQKLELPAAEELQDRAIWGECILARLELPAILHLWGNPMPKHVNKLVLPGTTMCVLHSSAMLDSVDAVYVPQALLQQYRSDTNWAYGADRIFAIEDGGAA